MMRIRLALLIALCSFVSPLQAQDAETPIGPGTEPTAEPPPEYAGFVQEALQESAEGNWADARAAFRQAHQVFPNARTERGMGMVSFELRDYVDVVRHLRRAIANQIRPLTERQTIEVQALLDRSLGRVASFGLGDLPEGASISVDGREVQAEEDETLLLPIGEHEVVVQGERRWESTIPVRGGEHEPLPMSFDMPEPDVVPGPAAPAVGPSTPAVVAPSDPPVGAIALTIGGAVALLSGIAILAAGLADFFAVQSTPATSPWTTDLDAAYGRTQALQGVGYAVMGLGAVLTVGGAIWLGTDGGDSATGAQLRLGGAF